MKKIEMLVAFVMVLSMVFVPLSKVSAAGGFDELGYNYKPRIFVGLADMVDGTKDGMIWGDPTYANGHMVMMWNEQWDICNANGSDDPQYCLGAWETIVWNGISDGSKSVQHQKMIWVGSDLKYWIEGGYIYYGVYEVIWDFGSGPDGHIIYSTAAPGLGHK